MAKSTAKKLREHDIRNGKRDVTLGRGVRPDFSTHERKTPTRTEKLEKEMKKFGFDY